MAVFHMAERMAGRCFSGAESLAGAIINDITTTCWRSAVKKKERSVHSGTTTAQQQQKHIFIIVSRKMLKIDSQWWSADFSSITLQVLF